MYDSRGGPGSILMYIFSNLSITMGEAVIE